MANIIEPCQQPGDYAMYIEQHGEETTNHKDTIWWYNETE